MAIIIKTSVPISDYDKKQIASLISWKRKNKEELKKKQLTSNVKFDIIITEREVIKMRDLIYLVVGLDAVLVLMFIGLVATFVSDYLDSRKDR